MTTKHPLTFKDKLEILEAVCTICVSVMALWGAIVAGQHDLWHKLRVLIDHYHAEIVRADLTSSSENMPIL